MYLQLENDRQTSVQVQKTHPHRAWNGHCKKECVAHQSSALVLMMLQWWLLQNKQMALGKNKNPRLRAEALTFCYKINQSQ